MARLPNAAVCDTHALVYYALGAQRLSRTASNFFDACEARRSILYVPAVVIMEFGFVTGGRRARVGVSMRDFFEGLFANPAFQPYELTAEQVYLADEAGPNDDPFDRLICAAARRLDLPLLTRDDEIAGWDGVRTIW